MLPCAGLLHNLPGARSKAEPYTVVFPLRRNTDARIDVFPSLSYQASLARYFDSRKTALEFQLFFFLDR